MNNNQSNQNEIKFKQEIFDQKILPQSISYLVYGCKVEKFINQGKKKHERKYFLYDDEQIYLQWISPHKAFIKSRINVKDIIDISREIHWKNKNKIDQKRFLRIQTKSYQLGLYFQTNLERDYFQCGMQYFAIQAQNREIIERKKDEVRHLANKLFANADKDGNKALNLDEVKTLLHELHINVNKKYLQQLFKTYDVNKNGTIDQQEFLNIIRDINKKEELHNVFKKYCNTYSEYNTLDFENVMTVVQFQKFIKEEQKEDPELLQLIDIFKNINSQTQLSQSSKIQTSQNQQISFYQFSNHVFSLENSIFDPKKERNYQSMDHPLTDYYINSSHNTYLMGNQLTGESSCQAYINAFQKGCRCVELDCWDGGDGEPLVYHGHTLTSRILLKDVLTTIANYAFQNSQYPAILSFENHCSLEQTKKIAQYLRDIFQEKLYVVPKQHQEIIYYQSPNQLKGKIIIKSKGKFEKAITEEPELGYVSDSEDEGGTQTDLALIEKHDNQLLPDHSNVQEKLKNQGKKKAMQKDIQQKEQIQQEVHKKQAPPPNQKTQVPINSNNQNEKITVQSNQQQNQHIISAGQEDTNQQPLHQPHISQKNNVQVQNIKGDTNSFADQSQFDSMLIQKQDSVLQQVNSKQNRKFTSESNGSEQKNLAHQQSSPKQQKKVQKSQIKVKECKEFLQITTMFGCHMKIDAVNKTCWYISSVSEVKYEKLIHKYPKELVEMFKKSYVRLYPAGVRVNSSNYDPLKGFLSGSQIVALNFQTHDFPMLMNISKFQENGGIHSGFVLKPDYLLHENTVTHYPVLMQKVMKVIKIQIISGQQIRPEFYENDTYDVVDPYVEVFVKGTDFDEKNNALQFTKVVSDNGFHPIWNSQVFEFKLCCPELSMIVFRVMDSDVGVDSQLGIYAIPADCIRSGYRVVPLRAETSLQFIDHSFILVKVEIEEKFPRYKYVQKQK